MVCQEEGVVHILLVEDNEGDVEMTERAVAGCSGTCRLSVVNDGVDALDFLQKQGEFLDVPDVQLIFLDLNMPRMDGKQFLEKVKRQPELKSIPVIMLTSSESPQDIRDCYDRYVSAYVVKPFDMRHFMETVQCLVHFWAEAARLPASA